MKNKNILIKNVWFSYDKKNMVLKDVNLEIKKTEFLSIIGPSGSGKSTLLYIIGKLLNPIKGNISNPYNKKQIGFVFQKFNLIPELTLFENAEVAQYIRMKKIDKEEILQISRILGISELLNKYPSQISVGEQQRGAILRAMVGKTELILADEPTGNLDSENKKQVMDLFRKVAKFESKTVVVVSHDKIISDFSDRTIKLVDGKII